MGKRSLLGVVGVLAVLALSTGATPISADAGDQRHHQEHLLPVEMADRLVADTVHAEPDPVSERWPSCLIGMTINYSVGSGVDSDTVRDELAYPVRYLQNLGYVVSIGNEVPYVANAVIPSELGSVLVVATKDPLEQPWIEGFRGWAVTGNDFGVSPNGLILINATKGLSSLVLLHELGHILGLGHKAGTVMSATGTDADGYDASETAAIDCRR